jgi:hypothetical protein
LFLSRSVVERADKFAVRSGVVAIPSATKPVDATLDVDVWNLYSAFGAAVKTDFVRCRGNPARKTGLFNLGITVAPATSAGSSKERLPARFQSVGAKQNARFKRFAAEARRISC